MFRLTFDYGIDIKRVIWCFTSSANAKRFIGEVLSWTRISTVIQKYILSELMRKCRKKLSIVRLWFWNSMLRYVLAMFWLTFDYDIKMKKNNPFHNVLFLLLVLRDALAMFWVEQGFQLLHKKYKRIASKWVDE